MAKELVEALASNPGPPRKVRGVGFRERYQLVGPSRVGMRTGLIVSVAAHVVMFGGALLYANLAPPRVIAEKPIIAKLVRLGKPRDEKMLPRLDAPPPPAAVRPPVAVNTPNAPPPSTASAAKTIDAPAAPHEKPNEALERQKRLMDALDKLGPPPTGPTAKVSEPLPGQADGDKQGDADDAAEGDRYLALVVQALKRSFVLPTTISQKERLYLTCTVYVKIAPDGKLLDARVETPSGNEQFDHAIEGGLQRLTLPPPPAGFLAEHSDGIALVYKP